MSRALVLGGGGVTGVAWELGVLRGLEAGGVPVAEVDLMVGTSAGAMVGARLGGGAGLDRLLQAQLEPPESSSQRPAELDWQAMGAVWLELAQSATGPEDFRARLALAVAASCAVPMVWSPVTIDGRRYMDGGTRSPTNADLAAGHDTVLVVAPIANPGMGPLMPGLGSELAALGPGSRVEVITPDDAALAAIGPNVLDPAMRAGAARAGLAQGGRAAGQVMALWTARPEAPPTAG